MLAIIFFVFVVFLAVLGMSFQMYLLCLCFVFVSACFVGGRVKKGAWSRVCPFRCNCYFFVFVFAFILCLYLSLYVFVSACIVDVGGRVKEGAWSLCVLAEAEPPLLGLGTRRSSQGGRSCLPKTKYKKNTFFYDDYTA